MLKMQIDNEEVVSKNDFTIKEEMLSASSTILNNTYPKTWENDKDYTSRFYYPKDYAKLNIQNFTTIQEYEAGTTVEINGSATLTDVDSQKNSRVLSLKGQTSQTTISGKNLCSKQNENNVVIATVPAGTYTFSMLSSIIGGYNLKKDNQSGTTIANGYLSSSTNRQSVSFTLAEETTIFLNGYSSTTGTSFANGTSEWQLESGSATAYVPYVGGTDSPNPSYPQPVHVVSGDNVLSICGKNLFAPSKFTTKGNVSITPEGIISSTAGSGDTWDYNHCQYIDTLQAGTYTFKTYFDTKETISWGGINIYDENNTLIAGTYNIKNRNDVSFTFTLNNTTNIGIMYKLQDGVCRAQLEKGSTATTYEPYVGQSYEVNLPVENLYSSTTITDQYTYIMPCNIGDTFTLSFKGSVSSGSQRVFLRTYNGTNPPTSSVVDTSQVYVTTTMNELSVSLTSTTNGYLYIATSASPTNYTFENIQLERGLKVNSYTPYGTTPIELCKIGNYQDYIFHNIQENPHYDSNLEEGKWYLYKANLKATFNGTETGWSTRTTSGGFVLYELSVSSYGFYSTTTLDLGYCNQYVPKQTLNTNNSFRIQNGSVLSIRNDTIGSLDNFKNGLSSNNLIIYFPLATPTTTEITNTELINQLNALESS